MLVCLCKLGPGEIAVTLPLTCVGVKLHGRSPDAMGFCLNTENQTTPSGFELYMPIVGLA